MTGRPDVAAFELPFGEVGSVGRSTDLPPVVLLDEFLVASEIARLQKFVLQRHGEFVVTEVIKPEARAGNIDKQHRRSRAMFRIGEFQDIISLRIASVFPSVLRALGIAMFAPSGIESQITASGDGDFFSMHNDSSHPILARRALTFVYFFHREPLPFQGGELRVYDGRAANGAQSPCTRVKVIRPIANACAFFPSEYMHEITPVQSSGVFEDSRFTLNGWVHR
jgi:Rps23 Pro-64 3,4-dihydroxylase Tpa1-like proline 4-hydroxylase